MFFRGVVCALGSLEIEECEPNEASRANGSHDATAPHGHGPTCRVRGGVPSHACRRDRDGSNRGGDESGDDGDGGGEAGLSAALIAVTIENLRKLRVRQGTMPNNIARKTTATNINIDWRLSAIEMRPNEIETRLSKIFTLISCTQQNQCQSSCFAPTSKNLKLS